jgi:hypothetical protein
MAMNVGQQDYPPAVFVFPYFVTVREAESLLSCTNTTRLRRPMNRQLGMLEQYFFKSVAMNVLLNSRKERDIYAVLWS